MTPWSRRLWSPSATVDFLEGDQTPFPFPHESASILRQLFANPLGALGEPEPEAVAAVLDLARWQGETEAVALLTRQTGDDPLLAGLVLSENLVGLVSKSDGRVIVPLRVPLLPSGEGAARVFAALVLKAFSPEADLERLGRHASNILVSAELRRHADLDPLTGLLSRQAFARHLPGAAERLAQGDSVAFMMVDVDGLRDLNAARGVEAGDELLKTMGALALGALGSTGVAVRYGGDELVLLVPVSGLDAATEIADCLRRSLDQLVGFGEPAPTVSIGMACGPQHGDDPSALLFRADQALGRAKAEGHGHTVCWSPDLRRQRRQDSLAGVLTGHSARDYRHVHSLLETLRDVSSLAPLTETLTTVVDRCVSIAGAERGLLLMQDKDDSSWVVRIARGPRGEELGPEERAFAESITNEALRANRAISRIAGDGPISPSAEQLGLAAVLCAPLGGQDVPGGVLYVDTRSRREPFDDATVAFFDALVTQVSVALRNSVLYERLLDGADQLRADVAGREQELVRIRDNWQQARSTLNGAPLVIPGLIGVSPAMQQVFGRIRSLEGTSVSVVVRGESGTGKELVSRAIHNNSERTGPLITVNCAAVAPGIFESELFGHTRGSFTGAHTDRQGLLEAAHGGTLFMDEIGELPLDAQAKLLRALQEGEIRRIGESTVRRIDVRVVAATNRDLQAMVTAGEFREDLYYRLAVFQIYLPALRSRVEDIPLIATHILKQLETPRVLGRATVRALIRQRWPGNVRQLRNALARAVVLAGDGPILPEHVAQDEESTFEAHSFSDLFASPLRQAKAAFSVIYTKEMLKRAKGSMPEAAKLAGVTRQTLYRILGT